jgi:hypothetical protein
LPQNGNITPFSLSQAANLSLGIKYCPEGSFVAGNPRVWIHLMMALRFRPINSPACGGLNNSFMHYNYRRSEKDEESVIGESVATRSPVSTPH